MAKQQLEDCERRLPNEKEKSLRVKEQEIEDPKNTAEREKVNPTS